MKLKLYIFILCSFAFINIQANINGWNQWRGGEKQGVVSTISSPLKWSDSTNVSWVVPIKGVGHSSPVVDNNSIYVTTSFYNNKNELLKILFDSLSALIIGLVFVYILFGIVKMSDHSVFSFIKYIGVFLILGVTLYFSLANILFKVVENGDHTNIIFRWLFVGYVLASLYLLFVNVVKISNKVRIVLSIAIFVFAILMFVLRPFSDYYPRYGAYIIPIYVRFYFLIIITIVSGILPVLKNKMPIIKQKTISLSDNKYVKIVVFIGLFVVFVIGFLGVPAARVVLSQILKIMNETPVHDLYLHNGFIFYGVLLLGALFVFFGGILSKKEESSVSSGIISPIFILLILMLFVSKNYFTGNKIRVKALIGINNDNGDIKWVKELFYGEQPSVHGDNSYATPTPIVVNDTVYAFFGEPGLACVKADGTILWKNNSFPYEGIHGVGASPIYYKGYIILASDSPKNPYLVKVDGRTGEIIWKQVRKSWEGMHGEHRTPTVCNIAGTDVVLIWSKGEFIMYDFYTGSKLSSIVLPCHNHELVSSILVRNDTIVAPDAKYLYLIDGKKMLEKDNNAKIWELDMRNKGPKCSSPVLYKNLIFTLSDNGFLQCVDLKNGERLYSKKLKGVFLSSLLIVNGNLYASNKNGETYVVKAGSIYTELQVNKLNESIYATITPCNNSLLIRSTQNMWKIWGNEQ